MKIMTKSDIARILKETRYPYYKSIIKYLHDRTSPFPDNTIRDSMYNWKRSGNYRTGLGNNFYKHLILLLLNYFPNHPFLSIMIESKCYDNRENFLEMFSILRGNLLR